MTCKHSECLCRMLVRSVSQGDAGGEGGGEAGEEAKPRERELLRRGFLLKRARVGSGLCCGLLGACRPPRIKSAQLPTVLRF